MYNEFKRLPLKEKLMITIITAFAMLLLGTNFIRLFF